MVFNRETRPLYTEAVIPRQGQSNIPHDKRQLVPDSVRAQVELEIINNPTTVLFRQLGRERVKVLVGRSLEHDNVLLVVRQAVNDVGGLFARFELLVFVETFLGLWCLRNYESRYDGGEV